MSVTYSTVKIDLLDGLSKLFLSKGSTKKLNNKNQNIGQIPYDQFTQGDKINKYTLWWSNWSIGKPFMLENNGFADVWNG